jgi:hypothetical protein
MHVVSFAQDLIYNVTRCKVQTPEHVGLAVLLKNLTGSAELVKVWSIQLTDNIFFSHPCFSADISTDRSTFKLLPGNMLFVCFCIASFVGGS